MNIRTRTNNKLKELKKQFEDSKEMYDKIATDLSLKGYMGVRDHDKLVSYYRNKSFAIKKEINLLEAVLHGE